MRRLMGAVSRHSGWARRITPPQLFAGSFLGLITFGTLGLRLLPGLYTGERLGWLDAAFTATSAVCVTGLIVVDTASFFSPAGQAFLLLLFQLGGLGLITLTSVIILAVGRRLSVAQEVAGGSMAELAPHIDFRHLTRRVLVFTFAFELAGALVLLAAWAPEMGLRGAVWPAVFHAVSAFCNAGFSIFSDSLVGFRAQPLPLVAVTTLIVVGGLGFLTMEELYRGRARRRLLLRRHSDELVPRLSLHSRLVLATTAVLLAGGWVLFTVFEWDLTLGGLPWWARIVNGLFMSATSRTAGFNTIVHDDAAAGTNFLTILLMFIGGSPGSTAGGVKTTTFALLGLLAWSRLRGHRHVTVLGRTVPEEIVQRAVGLFVVAFGVITVAIFIFTATEMGLEQHDVTGPGFLAYMFEAVSAFNTVGLSMGVTPELSRAGRAITIFLMYAGRVGPLTFAAAIALRRRTPRGFRYAHEQVVIG
jgi:trk system potassium uptake protein